MSKTRIAGLLSFVLMVGPPAVPVQAQAGTAVTVLRGFEEVPALSTLGHGTFTATINADGSEMTYELQYSRLSGPATQAHLHFGQKGVSGGTMISLCSNLGNGPGGTQACPAEGTITGTIHASDVG